MTLDELKRQGYERVTKGLVQQGDYVTDRINAVMVTDGGYLGKSIDSLGSICEIYRKKSLFANSKTLKDIVPDGYELVVDRELSKKEGWLFLCITVEDATWKPVELRHHAQHDNVIYCRPIPVKPALETVSVCGKEVAIKEGYERVTDPTLPKMNDWMFLCTDGEWTLTIPNSVRQSNLTYIRPIIHTKEDLERNGYVIFYGKHDELLKGDYVYYSDNCDVEEFQDNTRYLATAVYRHKSKLTKAEPEKELHVFLKRMIWDVLQIAQKENITIDLSQFNQE